MTQKPETALTKKILKRLRQEGGFWVKVHGGPYQVTGLPDVVGCFKGRFYGFEVKVSERSEPTPRQALILSMIKRAGGVSDVIRGPTEAIQAIRETHNSKLVFPRSWLTASQACVMIGFGIGEKPISLWKLKKMVESGEISSRKFGVRSYYGSKSIHKFLMGRSE